MTASIPDAWQALSRRIQGLASFADIESVIGTTTPQHVDAYRTIPAILRGRSRLQWD